MEGIQFIMHVVSKKRIDLDVLEKVCRYLQYDIADVLEISD